MTYQEADRLLQGRCRDSRKIGNNTYLKRDGDALHVRFHLTDILTFYPDGGFRATCGGWPTVTTKARLNEYAPPGWNVWAGGKLLGPGLFLFRGREPVAKLGTAIVNAGGKLANPADMCKAALAYREGVNATRRERYKERFWILKARQGGKLRKPLTLAMIQGEPNVSTRTAMIKVYSLERFLVAVNADVLDTKGAYNLLTYPMPGGWQHIRALKMVCPSTQTVYIHPVDPSCDTVAKALDWMFQTEGYLNRLTQEA